MSLVESAPRSPLAALQPGAFGLYDCVITHGRRAVIEHRFAHKSPLWVLDVDHIPLLPRPFRFVGRFDVADHWTTTTPSLRAGVEVFLQSHGVTEAPAQILLLTGARSGGHCFNPLSVYWCYDSLGQQTHIVAEVHNTYGGRHAYLLAPDEAGRADVTKDFYVSPFFSPDGRYRMRISPPGEKVDVVIALEQGGEVPFTAALHGTRARASRWTLIRRPLAQLRVTALIRIQGILLWKRGVKVQPRTGSPEVDLAVAGNLRLISGNGVDIASDTAATLVQEGPQ
ncbi:DUF1365 domain-containing protein [Nakamurella antarctica]|uniref:DUF1365 domain-containing protein n=1 Tax=Nakamurella antarctica TaxID=1902245 RepID=A0A3G8ZQJ3_9ACTN|nr:DUF1365 domain-containing protein [Nakamurella antarctica]AZI59075.1 DUF1365 domain-containing protein [Nakamurella antarctica]